jgi:hypothetical protein
MPLKLLSNPTVKINNVVVMPKANSVSIASGKGEKTVKGVSSGGGFVDVAVSEDVETKVGKIKMSFPTTQENIEILRSWQSIDISIGNVVSVTEDNFHAVMVGAIVINDPEMMIGVDESFEVEFHGRPTI